MQLLQISLVESMTKIDVSIIIINYKSTNLLINCIASIQEHTKDVSIEIIVVDNESLDDNIENISKNFQNVLIKRNKSNIGFSAANNQGFLLAKGKFTLILNNDTLFIENSLLKLVRYYEQSSEVQVIGCKLLNEDGSLQFSTYRFDTILNTVGEALFLDKVFKSSRLFNRYYLHFRDINNPIDTDVVKGAFILLETRLLNQLRGFDESFFFFGEETDLCFRAKQSGVKIVYYPQTQIIHLGGATVHGMNWFNFENLTKARIRLFTKNYGWGHSRLLLTIFYLSLIIRIPVYLSLFIARADKEYLSKAKTYLKLIMSYPKWVIQQRITEAKHSF